MSGSGKHCRYFPVIPPVYTARFFLHSMETEQRRQGGEGKGGEGEEEEEEEEQREGAGGGRGEPKTIKESTKWTLRRI